MLLKSQIPGEAIRGSICHVGRGISHRACARETIMKEGISLQTRRALLQHMLPQYREASTVKKKSKLLDAFTAATGYHRKYAMGLLNHAKVEQSTPQRPRPRHYGPEVQHALFLVWHAANRICAKRLIPFLPTLVEALERHEHLHLTEECRRQLLSMSTTTADRLLRSQRKRGQRGLSTTRAGTLLKQQIPVRTFEVWGRPGLAFWRRTWWPIVAPTSRHGVGYSRRNFLVPIPEAASYEELNKQLLDRCLQEDLRQVARQEMTIGQAWEQEHQHFLPIPRSPYECCVMTTVRLTPYSQGTFETNRYSVPVKRARREVTLKAYPFTIEIWNGVELLASHPRCYGRYQDILDPLHYLPLLEQRPGAFDFSKPIKQWKRTWPAAYDDMLADLRQKWPTGRGVQEFVKILELHQTYSAEVMRQAIEQALRLRCVHLDGVLYCIHEIERETSTPDAEPPKNLDLSHRPDLEAVGKDQRVNLAQYDQLLKQSW